MQINPLTNHNIDCGETVKFENRRDATTGTKLIWETVTVLADVCLMVSANEDFGDIENARAVGMQSQTDSTRGNALDDPATRDALGRLVSIVKKSYSVATKPRPALRFATGTLYY